MSTQQDTQQVTDQIATNFLKIYKSLPRHEETLSLLKEYLKNDTRTLATRRCWELKRLAVKRNARGADALTEMRCFLIVQLQCK